jgi:hypothetical protein
MAKWYGKVGYIVNEEVEPGLWVEKPTEKEYFGDTLSDMAKWSSSGRVNDNLNISSKVSIVADPFAFQNFSHIKYVEIMGKMWSVSMIEPQFPRLILTVGGLYAKDQTSRVTE